MAWRDGEDLLPLKECWSDACHYFCSRPRGTKGKGHAETWGSVIGADGRNGMPGREAGAEGMYHVRATYRAGQGMQPDGMISLCGSAMGCSLVLLALDDGIGGGGCGYTGSCFE
jgi:hypothetical protein